MNGEVLSEVQTSVNLSSSGTIFYSLPDPTSSSPNETISLTSFGTDYGVHFDSGSPERWLSYLSSMEHWKSKGILTYRLGFVFEESPVEPLGRHGSSVYTPEKLERTLEIFNSVDIKVIMMLQNNYDCQHYIGSDAWRSNWLDLAETFKGDQRLAAISLFSEPQHSESEGTPWEPYDTWDPSITSRFELNEEFAQLIREIHEIDPERVVIFPYPGFQYDNYNEWFADLQTIGIVNEPNVVFDIVHPYFFENEWDQGMTPTQKAANTAKTKIAPSVNFFGAERIWCGETFVWYGTGPSGNTMTRNLQIEWITAIINQFDSYNMAFNIWVTIPDHTSNWDWSREGIEQSSLFNSFT